MLTIDAVGPGATIQDAGRFGLLRFGVTPAGPMDPPAFAIANLALGNDPGAAAIEVAPGGIALSCDVLLPLAFSGGGFRWRCDDRELPSDARIVLRPGETLSARAGSWGQWCYLAVPGGIDVAPVLGSRATHLRSGIGGRDGCSLTAGTRLEVASSHASELDDAEIRADWLNQMGAALQVVLGPQDDHFTAEAVATFLSADWRLAASADRMAYSLEGPILAHAGDFNIVSDGVALGAVQVAGDGKPLVLMADRQPTGGYPKIAHICRADIGRLAQLRPGQSCRFAAISVAEARLRLLALDATVRDVRRRLSPLRRTPPVDRLLQNNLIGGVTDGGE